jgi:hypothetical protein
MTTQSIMKILLVAVAASCANGFSSALFQNSPTMELKAPSKVEGITFELPDFEDGYNGITIGTLCNYWM